jgi:hypothetical protein
MATETEWLEPWCPFDEFGEDKVDMAVALERQIRREICKRHVLHGEACA